MYKLSINRFEKKLLLYTKYYISDILNKEDIIFVYEKLPSTNENYQTSFIPMGLLSIKKLKHLENLCFVDIF
jgi:hypothetical protein